MSCACIHQNLYKPLLSLPAARRALLARGDKFTIFFHMNSPDMLVNIVAMIKACQRLPVAHDLLLISGMRCAVSALERFAALTVAYSGGKDEP